LHQASAAEHYEPAHATSLGIDHRKLIMWAFLGSECMFFGTLIATNMIYADKSAAGPGANLLDIPVTTVSTFVLLMSSLMMVLALSALNHGNIRNFRVWLLCTAAMGATFLGFQFFEFYEFANHGLTPRTNLYGSSFFTLTGFHGAHVTGGVIWLLSLVALSFRKGHISAEQSLKVELAGLYWHFVDIVWIVIFTAIYLVGVTRLP
jgi:heme/copper-type cytochrome/quinol oxidase subunit 3